MVRAIKSMLGHDERELAEVGIFWFYRGKLVFKDAVPVAQGVSYGEAITGRRDHAEFWDELYGAGELGRLPECLREEYFSLPRGRVVYHGDTGQFFVLHGNNVCRRDLRTVAKSFNLPKHNTVFELDTHYCDFSDKEWADLMAS